MYNILSIFSGGGGLDLGFHGDFKFLDKYYPKLNFKTKFALDLNKDSCQTLNKNHKYFSDTYIVNDDIMKFKYQKLDKNYDVLIGGFPCVTFSIVGKQIGLKDDINGILYESYAKYVEYFKPKVFLAENVKGILSANKGEAIRIIKKRFEVDGYKLKIYLVNFADFGVPQLRERVLFIGIRNDLKGDFIPPEFTNKKNHITSLEAFKNIEQVKSNNNLMRIYNKTKKMLENIPEGGNFKDLPEELRIKALMSNIYRRLDRKKPAYTVLASGGGGTWGYHYKEPRALTNRERARLQGFPDDYLFEGSNTEVRRQIGNAVPPSGIYFFAKSIQNLLDGKKEEINLQEKNLIKEYIIQKKLF